MEEKHTKITVVIIIVIFILGAIIPFRQRSNHHLLTGTMYKVDFDNNMAFIKGTDGSWWGIEGTNTYVKGTQVVMTIDDNGTETRTDDIVVEVREAR